MLGHLSTNPVLSNLEIYTTKAISALARRDPNILDLSFGQPDFGPPHFLVDEIADRLNYATFLKGVKTYESSLGMFALRDSISRWYQRRYEYYVDPEREIMITHGGAEALTLAILCTTEQNDFVAVTDPSYMLYQRVVTALGRRSIKLRRTYQHGYSGIAERLTSKFCDLPSQAKCLIVNSPENPTGYVLSESDWEALCNISLRHNLWIIHDEVYDSMVFFRKHHPARTITRITDRSILVNSFSKKFGVPGLRIGWLCATPKVIELASKLHDYMYLGVNTQYELIAAHLISDARVDEWLKVQCDELSRRAATAAAILTPERGFTWPHPSEGAMFMFPSVRDLYDRILHERRVSSTSAGQFIAKYLLEERKVAVVPGHVYGNDGDEAVRIVLCSDKSTFDKGMERLAQ